MGPAGPIVVFAGHDRCTVDPAPPLRPGVAELRPCGYLDLRPRQHPLSARFQGLAADRRPDLFGIDGLSARGLQKYFYHKYGTTLRALIDEYGIDPYEFLDFAHDIDHSDIELNASLGHAIERLPGRKLILTNGSRKHAENVARKIGILDHFEDVFDIAASDFVPKPERRAYERFLDKHGVEPSRSAMFEDIAKNLIVPHDLGMTTTLIIPRTVDPFREEFEQTAVEAPHIDHITNDLADFLKARVLP
jgi:putative hydrolase of the HAD superfamily